MISFASKDKGQITRKNLCHFSEKILKSKKKSQKKILKSQKKVEKRSQKSEKKFSRVVRKILEY